MGSGKRLIVVEIAANVETCDECRFKGLRVESGPMGQNPSLWCYCKLWRVDESLTHKGAERRWPECIAAEQAAGEGK